MGTAIGACDAEGEGGGGGAVGVGDECLQPAALAPADGYDQGSVYIESGSEQCQTGVCMVYRLRGDPNPDTCVDSSIGCNDPETANTCFRARCADAEAIEQHVYCSCRCDGPNACSCPSGFTCAEALEWDETESYCVREATIND